MAGGSRKRTQEAGPPADGGDGPVAGADLEGVLDGLEDALVDRAIAIARTNGYAPYTTTIRAAWTEAVRSLTEALGQALRAGRAGPGGPMAEIDYRADPRFARMRAIARIHRGVGITLELYLGLFKHFRRVYLDALGGLDLPAPVRARALELTLDFFDESELSITADWRAASDDDRLQEMQARARALTLAKDRYVAIFESLRHPAFLLDRSHRLVHANTAAFEFFLGGGEAGDGLYRQGRRALNARLEGMLAALIEGGSETEREVWLGTTAGQRCFDLRHRPLHDAVGNIALGHLLQLYDITAHREATEKAQRAERQMSRFIATMSHEIRTPLHSVLGAADLLRGSDGAPEAAYLDVIQHAGQSLLQTLNNVLDFTKIEQGPPPARPVDTDLGPALEALCAMAAIGPEARRSRVALDIGPDVPARVRLDWAMARQILTNLLSNAMRHDDGRGIRLSVSRHDGALRFAVIDHGPGLPRAAAEALRRPFETMRARHTPTGGAGLGLAISRHLAGAMSGKIGFRNTASGARIWLEVPVAEAARAAEAGPLPPSAAGPAPGGRCLLVDDDKVGALVSEHLLARIGFEVDRAGTCAEARAAMARTDYDAVVADYLLPDGTGPDLVAAQAGAGAARFVALTANAEAVNASDAVRARFHAVLAKPTDMATLASALKGGRPLSAPGRGADGLAGLSQATVAAMAAAFHAQWSDFRACLAAMQEGCAPDGLADVAHRLAGTTAQLGLCELDTPLRALERRCREDEAADDGDLAALLAALDRPLDTLPSWRRLARQGAHP